MKHSIVIAVGQGSPFAHYVEQLGVDVQVVGKNPHDVRGTSAVSTAARCASGTPRYPSDALMPMVYVLCCSPDFHLIYTHV